MIFLGFELFGQRHASMIPCAVWILRNCALLVYRLVGSAIMLHDRWTAGGDWVIATDAK